MGNNTEGYASEKGRIRRTVGYEEGRYEFRTMIKVPDSPNNQEFEKILVDLNTGIIPYVEVTQAELYEIRFGISIENSNTMNLPNKIVRDQPNYFKVSEKSDVKVSELTKINKRWIELISNLIQGIKIWSRLHILLTDKDLRALNVVAMHFAFFDIGQYRFVVIIGHFGVLKFAKDRAEMEANSNQAEYILETAEQKILRHYRLDRGGIVNYSFYEICEAIGAQ